MRPDVPELFRSIVMIQSSHISDEIQMKQKIRDVPSGPAAALATVTSPLDVVRPAPLRMSTAPPDAPAAEVPPAIVTSPPAAPPFPEDPASTTIAPAAPAAALPDRSARVPELPAAVAPVATRSAPLEPFAPPPIAVATVRAPLSVTFDAPLVRVTAPVFIIKNIY